MPRFSSAASAIITNNSHVSSTQPVGVLCCCVLTTPGSYSFTVPCYKGAGQGLGWPSMWISMSAGGGGGASGSSCGLTNGTTGNGAPGSAGSNSCVGSLYTVYGGEGGLLPKTDCFLFGCANAAIWACASCTCNTAYIKYTLCCGSLVYAKGGTGTVNTGILSTICCGFCGNQQNSTSFTTSPTCSCWCGLGDSGSGLPLYYQVAYNGYNCNCFLEAATGASPCCGGGGYGGIGLGQIQEENLTCCKFLFDCCGTLPTGRFWGGGGGGGGNVCLCLATGMLTPGSTLPIVVGAGGSGGNGWPNLNVCQFVCCCVPSVPALYAWGWWPRNYSCGATGRNGYVIICYYC